MKDIKEWTPEEWDYFIWEEPIAIMEEVYRRKREGVEEGPLEEIKRLNKVIMPDFAIKETE